MNISSLIEAKAELTDPVSAAEPIVLSTRLRLARNLANTPFPGWAKKTQRRDILASFEGAMAQTEELKGGISLKIENLTDLEKQILFERRLISRELMSSRSGAGVVISNDQSCAVMINEEDHLRIQMLRRGLHFNELWKAINRVDTELEKHLDFAFSESLGYLTACPTNVGTGIRASAMLHLPGLVMANQMEQVIRAVNQAGITVRGLFGEGSDASGSIFQISNQQTLGESEEQILKKLSDFLVEIIEQEKNARHKLIEGQPERIRDKIGRAYGILCQSHLLTSVEAMNLLSVIRLAIDIGVFPEKFRFHIDKGFIECQPGHIQYAAKSNIDPDARDTFRALHLREQTSHLPTPDFSGIN